MPDVLEEGGETLPHLEVAQGQQIGLLHEFFARLFVSRPPEAIPLLHRCLRIGRRNLAHLRQRRRQSELLVIPPRRLPPLRAVATAVRGDCPQPPYRLVHELFERRLVVVAGEHLRDRPQPCNLVKLRVGGELEVEEFCGGNDLVKLHRRQLPLLHLL